MGEKGENRRRIPKGELTPEVLRMIVAAGRPAVERKPDSYAIAAMTLAVSEAGVQSGPSGQAAAPVAAKAEGEGSKAALSQPASTEAASKPALALDKVKFVDGKEPALVEKTFYTSTPKPPADPATTADPKAAQPGDTKPPAVKSVDVKLKHSLYDTGDRPIAKSADGTRSATWSSEANVFLGAGIHDKEGKLSPGFKAGVDHTTSIKGTIAFSDATKAKGTVEFKSEATFATDPRQGDLLKAKLGVEAAAEGSLEHVHKVSADQSATVKATANAKATAELSVGLSAKDGFKVKGEVGASAGAGVGGVYQDGGHAAGGFIGVEVGAGAAANGSGSYKDGKLSLSVDLKLAVGLGAKLKIEGTYDAKEAARIAEKVVGDTRNPDSPLAKALAQAQDPNHKQKVFLHALAAEYKKAADKRHLALAVAPLAGLAEGLKALPTYTEKFGKTGGGVAAGLVGSAEALERLGGSTALAGKALKLVARLL